MFNLSDNTMQLPQTPPRPLGLLTAQADSAASIVSRCKHPTIPHSGKAGLPLHA